MMLKRILFAGLAVAALLSAAPTNAQAEPPWARHGWDRHHREHDRWREHRYDGGYHRRPPFYYGRHPRPYYHRRPGIYVPLP